MNAEEKVLIKNFVNDLSKHQLNDFLKIVKIIKKNENASLEISLEALKYNINNSNSPDINISNYPNIL